MSVTSKTHEFNSGSHWHRWDPHIHAPGTILEDQFWRDHDDFEGDDVWDKYFRLLENATPLVRALGITDYYVTDCYEHVCEAKRNGRLPQCDLIFPNVEMRYDKGTVDGRWINVHLLVSPEDPNHLEELNRFLARLRLDAHGDSFDCTKADLIRLGKRVNSAIVDDAAALEKGCEQVKVVFENLRDVYSKSDWPQRNIIVGVSGTRTDGTSGMDRGAGATLREELEKFAHVIFTSSPAQRAFWIGDKSASVEQLRNRYGGPKPCIHGCDAHELAKVSVPDDDRYTWLKGLVAFDTLRQACIDPKGRAFVGPQPPITTIPSQAIASIEILGADWAKSPKVEFNPGLVAIIGARGSGKSALAEMTALACDSVPESQSENSFLSRAAELLTGVSARLRWHSGESAERRPQDGQVGNADSYPRARYLSQHFVEELCAADHVTDGLIEEIQRVIYEAHSPNDRDYTSNFDELLELRVAVLREARQREETALADLSERIGVDKEKQTQIPALRRSITDKTSLISRYKSDRTKLVSKGTEQRVNRLEELTQAAEKVRGHLRYLANQKQSLLSLEQEVKDHRTRKAPEALRQSKVRYQPSRIKDEDWERFLLEYKGDVDEAISAYQRDNESATKKLKGTRPAENADLNVALIGDEADPAKQPLALLDAEISRLRKLVNVDKESARKFTAISKRVDEETAALERLKERLEDCEGAAERIEAAQKERDAAYAQVFESIAAEEAELHALYAPLGVRLTGGTGAIQKLSFTVKRQVDVDLWASRGEELLDLRRLTPFQGRGKLRACAKESLEPAWESGIPRPSLPRCRSLWERT